MRWFALVVAALDVIFWASLLPGLFEFDLSLDRLALAGLLPSGGLGIAARRRWGAAFALVACGLWFLSAQSAGDFAPLTQYPAAILGTLNLAVLAWLLRFEVRPVDHPLFRWPLSIALALAALAAAAPGVVFGLWVLSGCQLPMLSRTVCPPELVQLGLGIVALAAIIGVPSAWTAWRLIRPRRPAELA